MSQNRTCKYCGEALVRKQWKKEMEREKRFQERQYCDNEFRSKQLAIDSKGEKNYFYGKHLTPYNKRQEDYWENEDSNGYIRCYTRESNGYIEEYKHRKVMEDSIGRKLEKGEIVHHIDFDTKNNNIENLQLMTQEEHNQLHAENRWKS